jgi:hypothetical protein
MTHAHTTGGPYRSRPSEGPAPTPINPAARTATSPTLKPRQAALTLPADRQKKKKASPQPNGPP